MQPQLLPFLNRPLRRVLYYRPEHDVNIHLNHAGAHDVGQGVELAFDTGYFFVTWDNTVEQEISVQVGRMVDWLKQAIFEDVSDHADWQSKIGKPLSELEIRLGEIVLRVGEQDVFIVTAEIDRQDPEIIDGMADNLVVFFSRERRNAFFAQYPNIMS